MARFAAIGLDHRHIYDLTEGLLAAGNVDIAGRDGGDHVFLVDGSATRHIPCEDMPVTYFSDFLVDVAAGRARAVPQPHIFAGCRLALEAQAKATRFVADARP